MKHPCQTPLQASLWNTISSKTRTDHCQTLVWKSRSNSSSCCQQVFQDPLPNTYSRIIVKQSIHHQCSSLEPATLEMNRTIIADEHSPRIPFKHGIHHPWHLINQVPLWNAHPASLSPIDSSISVRYAIQRWLWNTPTSIPVKQFLQHPCEK